jgi:outer membrane receptor protein involved in Fe transport
MAAWATAIQPHNTQDTMPCSTRGEFPAFRRHLLPFACIASVLTFGPLPLAAQITEPSSEDVIRLNPFEVIESEDDTFRAMSVGSGSRLRLELKDTPVAYSVINREFIDALGIVDLVEAAAWGTGQSFYQTDNGGDGFGRPSQYFSRGNRTDQGGDSTGPQRNFYQNANNNGDSYAVESYDFGRGPNAALFGSGSDNGGLSGVSSIQSKRARFDNSRTTIAVEYGSWDYRRATIDINRPITDRIGIRINAVDFDRRYWRTRDMQTSRGLTVTATYRITDNLEFRIEGSTEKMESHQVGGGWDEQLTAWDGHTSFRGPITDAMWSNNGTAGANNVANASYGTLSILGLGNGGLGSSAAGLTYGGQPNGVKRESGDLYLFDPYEGSVMNYRNYGSSIRNNNNTRASIWSRNAPNGAFYARGLNSPSDPDYGIGRSFHIKVNGGMPNDVFARAEENSRFRVPTEQFSASIEHEATGQRSKDLNAALTFTYGNFAAEIGGDINRNHNWTTAFDHPQQFGGRSATIDLAMLRPDGTPNNGYLDVINYFAFSRVEPVTKDQTFRVNMGYTADMGRLGSYVFNVQGSTAERDFIETGLNLSLKQGTEARLWHRQVLKTVTHWSDTTRAWTEPTSVTFTDVDWTDPNNPVILAPQTVQPQWVTSFGNVGGGTFLARAPRYTRTENSYALAQMTARWFNDRVIFTGAVRRDRSQGFQRNSLRIEDYPANWNGTTILYRPDAPADYWTMTYVELNNKTGLPVSGKPRLSGNRPRTTINGFSVPNPLYANDRFRDDYNAHASDVRGTNKSLGVVWHATNWLSPYFNFSDTYTPANSTSLDLLGNVRRPVSAYGYDFGANLNILNDRVTLKYNYYRQVRENDSFNTGGISGNINTLYEANHYTDADDSETGRNVIGAQNLQGNDYQVRRNQGYELELSVEGMIPGLRITANGSYGWFSAAEVGPLIREYFPKHVDTYRRVLEDAGGLLDTTQKPIGAPSAPGLAVINPAITAAFPDDQADAVDAYNNMWRAWETLTAGAQTGGRDGTLRTPTQPQMNIVVDYTLQRGLLAGLGMSGGIQWQGRVPLQNRGNQTIIDPNNPSRAVTDPSVSSFDYRFQKGAYQAQANLRYTWNLDNGNSLRLALRVDNPMNYYPPVAGDASLGGGTGFGGYNRQPEGDLSKPNRVPLPDLVAWYKEPLSWRLSATYTFGGGLGRTQ